MNDVLYVTRGLLPVVLGNTLLPIVIDDTLLSGETDGLAIDWTATADLALSTWAMQAVQERNSSVDTLQSPHVFFNQSGTSPKYVKGSATTLAWSPHNICLQSQVLTTTWLSVRTTLSTNSTTAPDGTVTAETLTANATNVNGSYVHQTVTGLSGVAYTASVYLKQDTENWAIVELSDFADDGVRVWFDLANGVVGSTLAYGTWTSQGASITSVGSGWYRCSVATTIDVTAPDIATGPVDNDNSLSVTNGASIFAWGGQINRGILPTAYISTTTATRIGLPISYGEGLLVEPAATNLVLSSQALGTTDWAQVGVSLATDAVASPDGSTTAETMTATAGSAEHGMASDILTTVASTIYTTSAYLKAGTNTLAIIVQSGNSTSTHWVAVAADLSNGTITQTSNGAGASNLSSAIVAVGGGWYRLSVTGSYANTNTSVVVYITDDATPTHGGFGAHTWTAAGTETIHVWGVQTELGTVATSYVPTTTASATRAADLPSCAPSSFPYSETANSLVMWVTCREANAAVTNRIIEITEATDDEIFICQTTADTPDKFGLNIFDSGDVVVNTVTKAGTVSLAGNKVAAAWTLNNSGIVVDGSAEVTDTSCTMPTGMTQFNIAHSSSAARAINGFVRRLISVPRRMTEAELQGHTT